MDLNSTMACCFCMHHRSQTRSSSWQDCSWAFMDWESCVHGNCWALAAMGYSAGSIHCAMQIRRSCSTLLNPMEERKKDQSDGLPVSTYTACHTCTVSS